MPELPEVEGFRQYIEGTALHLPIRQVEVRDTKVLLDPQETFCQSLQGRQFEDTERIGKFLFLKLDNGRALLMHFGMTGSPRYYRDPEDAPRFPRVIFHFENDFSLAFNCPRKFGRLQVGEKVSEMAARRKLGPDAAGIDWEQFESRLRGRKINIKNALMNQSIFAGLGNWMVDEILYQAQVHPEERIPELDTSSLQKVHQQMLYIIQVALKHEAHYPDFPAHFMIHSRWTDAGRPDAPRLDLAKLKVGGRSTYIDPQVQVLQSRD